MKGLIFVLLKKNVVFNLIKRWGNLPLYLEQYNSAEAGEGGIAEEVEKYTDEIDRDWTIKPPKDIQEVCLEFLELKTLC